MDDRVAKELDLKRRLQSCRVASFTVVFMLLLEDQWLANVDGVDGVEMTRHDPHAYTTQHHSTTPIKYV